MLGALAETHDRDVGPLTSDERSDVLDIDLSGDHLMAQGNDGRGHERETILALVGEQRTELLARPARRASAHTQKTDPVEHVVPERCLPPGGVASSPASPHSSASDRFRL